MGEKTILTLHKQSKEITEITSITKTKGYTY